MINENEWKEGILSSANTRIGSVFEWESERNDVDFHKYLVTYYSMSKIILGI